MDKNKKSDQKKNILQAIKFTLFSISAGVIQLVTFSLMNEVGKLDYWLSYAVALSCSVIWNFTFNRKFTFKSAANVPKAMLLAFLFYVPFAPLSILWGAALENIGWNEYLVVALTMIINFVLEFTWQKFVVFRDTYKKEKMEKNSDTITVNEEMVDDIAAKTSTENVNGDNAADKTSDETEKVEASGKDIGSEK